MDIAQLAPQLATDDELNVIGERVDSLHRQLSRHSAGDTQRSREDDERLFGEVSALLRDLYQIDNRHRLAGGDVTDPIHFRIRHSTHRMYPIENLLAYSEALCVAADTETMLRTYVEYVAARDLAVIMGGDVPMFTRHDEALSDRLFCKYVLEAVPVVQEYDFAPLYGPATVARIIDIIDDLTEQQYVDNARGVLHVGNARRIAQYTEKIHAYYAERFQIGPMNIARTPRTGMARVLFASWQDLNQMNQLFPKDVIIDRALQNTPIGDEIVMRHAEFVESLDYCAEDMRSVMSTAWFVAQQTAYMRLTLEQRQMCAEIVNELRVLAIDVRDMIHSHDGDIFYRGLLKKKYDQLLVVDLRIAIERYSCESV